jgi:hypothetical protein
MKNYAIVLDGEGASWYLFPSPNPWAGKIAMARGRQSPVRMLLSPDERHTLARWQRSTTIVAGLARRGTILLLRGPPTPTWRRRSACNGRWSDSRPSGFSPSDWRASPRPLAAGPRTVFPPEGHSRGVAGLRASRYAGPQLLAEGVYRTGASAHRRGRR